MKLILIEHHPQDARERITDICQTLNLRMGSGGGNVPLVVMIDETTDSVRVESESCNDKQ